MMTFLRISLIFLLTTLLSFVSVAQTTLNWQGVRPGVVSKTIPLDPSWTGTATVKAYVSASGRELPSPLQPTVSRTANTLFVSFTNTAAMTNYTYVKVLTGATVRFQGTFTLASTPGELIVSDGPVSSSALPGIITADMVQGFADALNSRLAYATAPGLFATATASTIQYDNSTWERKAGTITPNGGTTLAGPAGYYYQRTMNGRVNFGWFHPNPNGTTGNADLLEKALAVGLPVEIPDDGGKYCIERSINLVSFSTRLVGSGTLTAKAGNYALFSPQTGAGLYMENVHFDLPAGYTGDVASVPGSTVATESNATFRGLKGVTAGAGKLIYVGVRRTNTTISDCDFTGGTGLCLLWGTQKSTVQRCRYTGSGRAIQFYGGSYNTIENNVIDGLGTAITGITFFSWRSNNQSMNLARGNVITGNIIYRVTEEGISFDMIGNDATRSPEHPDYPVVTVSSAASVNANQVQVNLSDATGAPSQWAYEYYAVVMTGNAMGHICRINAAGPGFIMLDRWTGIVGSHLAAGDKILITTGYIQNVVTNNTIKEVGTHGISFYGSAWGNRAAHNTIMDATWRGISIVSVLSGGSNAHGYSGLNVIENNTLSIRDDPADKYDTLAAPHASIMVESRVYSGGDTPITPRTIGNIVRNNTLLTAQPIYVLDAWDTQIEGNRFPNNSLGIFINKCTRVNLINNRTVSKGLVSVTQLNTNTDVVIGDQLAQLSFTQNLTYDAIAAGGFQTQFVSLAGLKMGDVALVNPTTLPPGIAVSSFVTDNSGAKVAVRLFNYTSASITPGTLTFNGLLNRKLPTQ